MKLNDHVIYLNCRLKEMRWKWTMNLIMMMMMNRFSGMVDRQKKFSPISSREHCQSSSSSQISDTPCLNTGFIEWSCAAVITTTSRSKIYSEYFHYSGPIKACIKISLPHKNTKKNFIILQTNRLSNSSSA